MPKGSDYNQLNKMYLKNSENFRKLYKSREPTQEEKDTFIKKQKNILKMKEQLIKKRGGYYIVSKKDKLMKMEKRGLI